MANVSTSAQLRTAIQNASASDPAITLDSGSYSSITTLAKLPSYIAEPAVGFNGYSITGTLPREGTIINDTRIYQQNIDGSYAPSVVEDLTLQYNSASTNNTAILRATSGSYSLDNLLITGQHSGWAGNGGVYMSLAVSSADNAINADLTLTNSTVSVTGQNGNAAFLQSWNNNGKVTLANNEFNEAGLNAGSFHFATMPTASSVLLGMYEVSNNTFTGSGVNKSRGNRLETVEANIFGNTFDDGAFLDLYGDVTAITLDNNSGANTGNTFNTIYGGVGVKFNRISSSGAILVTNNPETGGSVMISDNEFTGYGLAITNNNTSNTFLVTIAGQNTVKAGTLATQTFDRFVAGGSTNNNINVGGNNRDWINAGAGNDTIMSGQGADYIIGGLGNDSITSGTGNDTILYYETTEGQDIITDFTTGVDSLAFRGKDTGGTTFFNFAPGSSLTLGTNFFTSAPPALTPGPIFTFIGGLLSYDSNGSDPGGAFNIATFSSGTVTASDIKFF
jgi:hypothetical protein